MARYDTAVIGTGPAGLEAAVNLQIRKKRFLLFGNGQLSDKIRLAPHIDNYLGLPGITGKELVERFDTHLSHMDIAITREQVSSVYPMGDYFAIATNKDTYEATTLILATGVAASRLLPGEERLLGKGVGYCATCDAPLYKGKTAAIVGYTEESVYEANFIAEIARQVYFVPMKKLSTPLSPNIVEIAGKVKEIAGDAHVSSLVLEDRSLAVDGVFVLRESIAPSTLLPGLEVENGFIKVTTDMSTNLPGCYAAGDCTGKPHQYMRAAGQGQTAALSAVSYLDRLASGK